MIYFIYKLKIIDGNGYPPKQDCSEDWLSIGFAAKSDGTFLGYSTKTSLLETFTPAQIADHEIVEITTEQAKTRCGECGMNSPALDLDGKVKDNNPPYLEKRGWDYIAGLGGTLP